MPSARRMETTPSSLLSQMTTLDVRSLALCRIAAGVLVIGDLLTRLPDGFLHYSDSGILPRALLHHTNALRFPSLYAMSGSEWYLLALGLFHAAVGLSLALGYRTRCSGFLAWYLTLALQERCFMANNGGDRLFASVLFWGMFLPWGHALSVDSARGSAPSAREPQDRQVTNVATAIFLLQPVSVYLISVFHKLEPTWLSGRVLHYALQSDFYAYPWAFALLAYPLLLSALAYATLAWEAIGPFFLLSPHPRLRAGACLAFAAMHLGFGLCLRIGIFTFSPWLYLLGLLPAALWQTRLGATLEVRIEAFMAALAARLSSSPPPLAPPHGRTVDLLLGTLFLYACFISLGQDARLRGLLPERATVVTHLTGLHQRWTVFVDTPQIFDGWIVVEGVLADGRQVDLFQGNDPVRWEKPPTSLTRYRSFRWPTPLSLVTNDPVFYRPFVAALAADWQRDHPEDRVTWARLVLFREKPWLDYRNPSVSRSELWEGNL